MEASGEGPELPREKKKQKELLTRIAQRLEARLHQLRRVFAAEQAANERARMRVTSLQIVLLCRSTLQQLVARAECAPPVIAALDEQARVLGICCSPYGGGAACGLSSTLCSDTSTATALAPSLGHSQAQQHQPQQSQQMQPTSTSAEAKQRELQPQLAPQPQPQPQPDPSAASAEEAEGGAPPEAAELKPALGAPPAPGGAVGAKTSALLMSILAARGATKTKREFVAAWREHVLRLAMLAHQYRNGAAGRDRMEQVLHAMGVQLGSCLLSQPWAFELLLENMETGAEEEPPPGWSKRVVRCMGISSEAASVLVFLRDWWARTSARLALERAALCQRAAAACGSMALRRALCARLELLNAAYLTDMVALLLVTHTSLLTPEQLSEVYLSSWPHLPTASRVFRM